MVVAAGGLLLVVVGCTCGCGWWWWAVLAYGGGLGQFFFFLGYGFCVIVGGAGVRLIPCDLGYINGVDSSLHCFFFFFFF